MLSRSQMEGGAAEALPRLRSLERLLVISVRFQAHPGIQHRLCRIAAGLGDELSEEKDATFIIHFYPLFKAFHAQSTPLESSGGHAGPAWAGAAPLTSKRGLASTSALCSAWSWSGS